jgi:dolichyl-phosphate beta-glucosyltransferase
MINKEMFLSIVIPCYNEEENLKKGVLDNVYGFMKTRKFSWEVIISDDGSTDKSKEIIMDVIKEFRNFRYYENSHGGKPSALWSGIQKAEGKYVLFTDMDQSTPISELTKLLPFVKTGVGAVIGSRGMTRKNFPVYRRFGAIVFMAFRKLLILPEISDTQCGFKLIRKSVLLKTFPKLEYFNREQKVNGWKVTSFDVELLHLISKLLYSIEEIPVVWEDTDKSISKGGGMDRYLKESKEMLFQILRVKINDLRGLYNNV